MNEGREYPWYDLIEGESLAQGDLLQSFELIIPQVLVAGRTPPDPSGAIPLENRVIDLVVMSQTCDIENDKVVSLLLCPRWDLWQFEEEARKAGQSWNDSQREALRRGNLPGYHLLNEAEVDDLHLGLSIVDFHEVYTAPTTLVKQFAGSAGKRPRLLPPYREHLAQAFARFFMRVGLPVDIPKEKLKKNPAST
ncbi:MAG: hypothetical protein HY718_00105 [Planctomycetes bacterium]|nr:hypothetical protein [Planctomycetota bacterium]